MKLLQRWLIGIFLVVLVVAIATCGTGEDKAVVNTEVISMTENDYLLTWPQQATVVPEPPSTTVTPEPPSTTIQLVAVSNNKSKNGYKSVEWNGDVAQIPADATKRCPQYEAKFAKYGLPVEIFSYISWRESRCNPKAENLTRNANGSSDHGLVQINSSWKTLTAESCGSRRGDLSALLNVDCNLKVAKRLLDTSSNPLGNWRL
jgi:hypothetical protein